MTEEIIDGVDVSECEFIDEYEHCAICKELIKTKEGRTHCFTVEDISCEFYPYCHYKQLKRLKAENAKLKSTVELIKEYALDMEVLSYVRKDLLDIVNEVLKDEY